MNKETKKLFKAECFLKLITRKNNYERHYNNRAD